MVKITCIKAGKEMNKNNQRVYLWLVLSIVQSNATSAYSIHIQAECYSPKGNLLINTNSYGVTWPGLVHYDGRIVI
jgi:hypothetical protein